MIMNDTNKALENLENKENAPKKKEVKEKRELTPAELQKRKKMIIFPVFFLVFAGCMWLIFAPSKKAEEARLDGFNSELPMPNEEIIVMDKRDAYARESLKEKQEVRMRSLQDYTFSIDDTRIIETKEEQDYPEGYAPRNYTASQTLDKRDNSFKTSASAYQDINRQLGHWYEEPATEEDEQSQLELEWRVQELERQLSRQNDMDKQVALLEKSYEIAARYMPNQASEAVESKALNVIPASGNKKRIEPVSSVRRNVVSRLSAIMPDSVFVEEFSKVRNWGFNTVGTENDNPDKNTILACIHKTVTVSDGQDVQIRLLEAMRAGNLIIPRNTVLTGLVRISGERLSVKLRAVQSGGRVISLELIVCDVDGNEGINVPGSEELSAMKEVTANMGSGLGSSITISDNAGSQLLSDLGRSAIQGTSQYISKKMRKVKVTLKAGYRVLLLPPENNL